MKKWRRRKAREWEENFLFACLPVWFRNVCGVCWKDLYLCEISGGGGVNLEFREALRGLSE